MFSEPHIQDPPEAPTDCRGDGCGECEVCKYLDWLEWAGQVAPPGSTIDRDTYIEKYLDYYYPHWRD